jgi:hypothetical protein
MPFGNEENGVELKRSFRSDVNVTQWFLPILGNMFVERMVFLFFNFRWIS